jgi:PAS domain S-box-containing protein
MTLADKTLSASVRRQTTTLVRAVIVVLCACFIVLRSEALTSVVAGEYSPRRAVYLSHPGILLVNVICDVLTCVSYTIFLAGLCWLATRLRHILVLRQYSWIYAALIIFIVTSGAASLMRVVTVWLPLYQFSIVIKIICAAAIAPAAYFFALQLPTLANNLRRFYDLQMLSRQQAERLKKSEELLDQTNRLAGVGGWEIDLSSMQVTWSDETCRIQGAAPGYQPTLEEGLTMYAPEARSIITAAVQQASAGGPGWDLELPLIRFDGSRIWARSVGAADIVDGRPVRLIGAFQDVTDKVEARKALQKANERVALATDSGGIGIWDWNILEQTLKCDAWMYRLHGKEPSTEIVAGDLWREHLHPDDKTRVEKALENAISGVSEFNTEFRVVWGDGSVHTLRGAAKVTRDADQKALHMVGANWDVTESRSLLAQVAEQHERLRVTLHSIGDGVITTDARGYVVWLNPVAERLTGWTSDLAVGRFLQEVFSLSNKGKPEEDGPARENTRPNARTREGDTRLLSRDGMEYGIEHSADPIRNAKGEFLGAVLVFRDVTERRRSIYEAENATQMQLQLKDQFLSHVSHELRSPLTSIYSFSSIIADGLVGDTTPEQKEYLQIILKNVAQLQTMIEDLLTVTQSREGKLTFDLQRTAIMDAVVDTVHSVRGSATKKNICIEETKVSEVQHVFADPIRLRQLLIILLDNAIKFTPNGGRISLQISQQSEDVALVQVRDTGCGIPAEKWLRVFDNLYQVTGPGEADTSQAGRTGLGLGLHIAKNLVARQGGSIWVTSTPGLGSIFQFTLPIYSDRRVFEQAM